MAFKQLFLLILIFYLLVFYFLSFLKPATSSTSNFKSDGLFSFILQLLKIICLSLVTLVIVISIWAAIIMYIFARIREFGATLIGNIQSLGAGLNAHKPPSPRVVSSIIEVYKKVELEEYMKPLGINHTLCPICKADYASNETVVCLLECEHCFHIQCIDAWLQLHSSCPTCRNEVPTLRQVCDE